MNPLLSTQSISKTYGSIQALKSVSFNVPEGSIFGILGPNGSGKTTLLGILLNVLLPDSGSYSWSFESNEAAARKHIGSLLETPNFYHYLSAWDNLEIAAQIKGRGLEDRERVLKITNLWERKDSKFQTFSLGMKQRLAIAAALLGRPKVLVLDEPTNGLDPVGIAEIRHLITQLNQEGLTIIMASHLLDEVEKVCNHVAILKSGTLLLSGNVNDVLSNEDKMELSCSNNADLLQLLKQNKAVKKAELIDQKLLLVTDEQMTAEQMNKYCAEHGFYLSHLQMKNRSLESKFMEITQ